MSDPVEVRTLAVSDLAVLDRIAPDVFDHAILHEQALRFLEDPRHHLVVAVENGTVVGMISSVEYLHPDTPPALWINEVGVAPSHYRRGIGRRMMERTLEVAREIGCATVWVGTAIHNEAARALYESVGGEVATDCYVQYEWDLEVP